MSYQISKKFHLFVLLVLILLHKTNSLLIGTQNATPTDFINCVNWSLSDTSAFPDVKSKVPDIIIGYNYPLETHDIITADGYILTAFRIYNSQANFTKDENKVPVFLQHGFLGSSADWVLNNVDNSLGFKLADSGFDVWLGNSRGTNYSLGHVSLSSDDVQYWNFSLHEEGKFDLPAVIDHILVNTNQLNIHYVGHSMACPMFFIMMSEHPEYNSKIRTMIALAPTVFRGNSGSPLNTLINPIVYGAQPLYSLLGGGRLVPAAIQQQLPILFGYGCTEIVTRCGLCQNALFFMYGYDPYQMNYTQLPIIMTHQPDSVSSKTFIHLAQMEYKDLFRQFDYNPFPGNQAIYGPGINQPQSYNLSATTIPVVIYKGLGDTRATPVNVDRLAAILPNVKSNIIVPFEQFNHLDFLFANDVNSLVYNGMVNILIQDD